ncbi:uncharacterized protein C2845_PM18G09330 [Panicum miliaceum]|uniref:Uncharacterized protein n=1 Tax=Panicum miliaceum TaxID=4540 RepID=A0A3L6PPA8_PANMI|nr:uncharacterized protein C2845_PM18G09330 [Panicum miliaceum]
MVVVTARKQQYVLCGLYWGYTKTTTPELAENGFFVLDVVASVVAAEYTVCSPLGKDDQCHELAWSLDTQMHPTSIGHVVMEPKWAGRMFNCSGNISPTWCLSLSCTFYVLEWNMEAGFWQRLCARYDVRAAVLRAPLGAGRLGAAHPRLHHRRHGRRRWRAALRLRAALRRLPEDPDAEEIWPSGEPAGGGSSCCGGRRDGRRRREERGQQRWLRRS